MEFVVITNKYFYNIIYVYNYKILIIIGTHAERT